MVMKAELYKMKGKEIELHDRHKGLEVLRSLSLIVEMGSHTLRSICKFELLLGFCT